MRKLEYQQGLLDEPAELEESDFLESIARAIFRKGGGLLGELLNPAETGLDEGYLDDQGRLVVTEPLVRERNFRNWFGDSKVVDEEGRPKVMYHSGIGDSADNWEYLRPSLYRGAVFVSSDPESASYAARSSSRELNRYGQSERMYPVLVKGSSIFGESVPPLLSDVEVQEFSADDAGQKKYDAWWQTVKKEMHQKIDGLEEEDQVKEMAKELADLEMKRLMVMDTSDPDKIVVRFSSKKGNPIPWQIFERGKSYSDHDGIGRRAIQLLGYDAAHISDEGKETIGVFEPTQIKSIHNRGTYNPDDPDMLGYYQRRKGLLDS